MDAGDIYLKEHLETCAKMPHIFLKQHRMSYLNVSREYIYDIIVDEISSQEIG